MNRIILLVLLLYTNFLKAAVYDCFTFYNEIELLDVRLHELNDVVDYFVIVEGTKTFTGFDKPLHFQNNADKFKKFEHKIIHLVLTEFPPLTGDRETDHWNREIASRNFIMKGLENCHPDDTIILADLDEIPKANSVIDADQYLKSKAQEAVKRNAQRKRINQEEFVCDFEMRLFSLSLNREYDLTWFGGCKAVPFWLINKETPWNIKIYHHSHQNLHKLKDSGWHFNGMGGDLRVVDKWLDVGPLFDQEAYLRELREDPVRLAEVVQSHRATFTKTVEIDDTFPRYILDNLDYFRELGWIWEGD